MSDREMVSAIIPTYNRADLLPRALDSVLGQTRRPDQVLVVDDGSTDGTSDVLARYGDRITVIQQANAGKSTTLNRAVSRIETGWVWIFDDDDIAYPDAVQTNLTALRAAPDAAFTYSARTDLFTDDTGNTTATQPVDLPQLRPDQILPALLENCFFHLQGSLIHVDCFKLLRFREDLDRAMDYEFMIQMARQFHGARVDQPTYYLRRHGGLRGPAHTRFHAADMTRYWHINEKKFFADLYTDLELREYVAAADAPDMSAIQVHSRLSRATVMGRKGLWPFAIRDLEAVASHLSGPDALPDADRRQLQRLTQRDHALFELLDDRPQVTRLRRILGKICQPDERFAIVQEMYFTMMRSTSHPHAVRRIRRVLGILYLLGWGGATKYASIKAKRFIYNDTQGHKGPA